MSLIERLVHKPTYEVIADIYQCFSCLISLTLPLWWPINNTQGQGNGFISKMSLISYHKWHWITRMSGRLRSLSGPFNDTKDSSDNYRLSTARVHGFCIVTKVLLEVVLNGFYLSLWVQLITICSDHVLSPGRLQAIVWTNAGILLIWTSRANFSEILSEIHTFSLHKMHLKMSSAKWRQFCLVLNVIEIRYTKYRYDMVIN